MAPYTILGICVVLWLASMTACVVAARLARLPDRRTSWVPAVLSFAALAIGYLGLTHFHFEASETVNGAVRWRFDTRWLFFVTVVAGACVAGYSLWRRRRSAHET